MATQLKKLSITSPETLNTLIEYVFDAGRLYELNKLTHTDTRGSDQACRDTKNDIYQFINEINGS